MRANRVLNLGFAIFIIVGLSLLAGGLFTLVSGIRYQQKATPVQAIITYIESYRDSDGDVSHDVYVTYSYGGVTYEDVRLNEYSSSMYEGKEITLYLDPSNPKRVKTSFGAYMVGGILMAMGVFFSLFGIIPIAGARRKRLLQAKFRETGRRISGVVDYIDYDTTYTVNGRNPFIVICSYTDDYSGVTYRFKSDRLWTNPYPVLQEQSPIYIYVMPDDYSKYYVDVEGALSGRIVDYT